MTAPGQNVPEGGYSVSSLRDLQALDEDAIKRKLRAPVDRAWGGLSGGFLQRLDEWGQEKIVKPLVSIFQGLKPAGWEKVAEAFQDGQKRINDRVDLLSPLQDYGAVFMNDKGGFLDYNNNYGVMPFVYQIGPLRGVELTGEGLRLLDKGLWDLRAQLTVGPLALGVGSPYLEWKLRVYTPQGFLYSEQVYRGWAKREFSSTVVSSVVVPEPGYVVKAEIAWIHGSRKVWGGPANNRLVVQHITRRVDGGTGAEDSFSEAPSDRNAEDMP